MSNRSWPPHPLWLSGRKAKRRRLACSGGPDELDPANVPPSAFTPRARYEKMAETYAGKGFFVTTNEELGPVLKEALATEKPSIVNIMISVKSQRKPQQFAWLTK